MRTISFNVTKDEAKTICCIAGIATAIARDNGVSYPLMEAVMDLTACHANGCPLRLDALLEASVMQRYDFTHDVFGIRRHIDRETGQLGDCFVPRFHCRQEG